MATSGPWKASKGVEDEPDRWAVVVDGPIEFFVAEIQNGAPGDTLRTEAENAFLMAAAPELRAALKAWLRYFDELDAISDPNDPLVIQRKKFHGRRLAQTRAALEKAEPPKV